VTGLTTRGTYRTGSDTAEERRWRQRGAIESFRAVPFGCVYAGADPVTSTGRTKYVEHPDEP